MIKFKSILIVLGLLLPVISICAQTQSRTLGTKSYEVSNHLGNVMAVVSDRKTPKLETTNTTIAFNETDIIAFNDYYPFGMLLGNRNGSSNYRFGFQGQEKDDEVKGKNNSVNYKYRVHDARLGRFFAVDPLSINFPYNSSYAFSENVVVNAVELEGREKSFSFSYNVYDVSMKLDENSYPNNGPTAEFYRNAEMAYQNFQYDKIQNYNKSVNDGNLPYSEAKKRYELNEHFQHNYKQNFVNEMTPNQVKIAKEFTEYINHEKQLAAMGYYSPLHMSLRTGFKVTAPLFIGGASSLLFGSSSTSYGSFLIGNIPSGLGNSFMEFNANNYDYKKVDLIDVSSGFLVPSTWQAGISAYLDFSIDGNFNTVNSFSDFQLRTFDFGVGVTINHSLNGLSNFNNTIGLKSCVPDFGFSYLGNGLRFGLNKYNKENIVFEEK